MSKFDEVVEKAVSTAKEHRLGLSEPLVRAIAKSYGPSIYNADSRLLALSDKAEVKRFCENFLIKKLGLSQAECDAIIEKAKGKYESRQRTRVLFSALCAKLAGKEDVFLK